MCGVVAPEKVIKDPFETDKKSIRSIGFHNVGIFRIAILRYRQECFAVCWVCHSPRYAERLIVAVFSGGKRDGG